MNYIIKVFLIFLLTGFSPLCLAESKSDYYLALEDANKALNKVEANSEDWIISKKLLNEAKIAANMGNFSKAIELSEKAEFQSNVSLWICHE